MSFSPAFNLFDRSRNRNHSAAERAEIRKDKREARLDRQEADLVDREAALNERERNVRRRERNVETEQANPDLTGPHRGDDSRNLSPNERPGATAPGRRSDMAAFILDAHAMATGRSDNVPLPGDKSARLIVQAALGEFAKEDRPSLNSVAKMIVNADLIRRGADVTELK
jgi:hypothetical protein